MKKPAALCPVCGVGDVGAHDVALHIGPELERMASVQWLILAALTNPGCSIQDLMKICSSEPHLGVVSPLPSSDGRRE